MSLDEVKPSGIISISNSENHKIEFESFQQFNAAAEKVKSLTKRPTDEELLQLYALFKQASFGDNTTSECFIRYVSIEICVSFIDRLCLIFCQVNQVCSI